MDAKLKALHLRLKKSDGIIAKREKEAIERQRASIVALAGEIDELRGSIQEAKFIQGETEEDVESWSEDVETQLSRADESVVKLKPSFHMSGKSQTIGDSTVSRPSQTFPTNENWKS